jgi:hypothetical protein
MAVTDQNYIYKEIMSILNMGNVYYHSFQNLWLLTSSLKTLIHFQNCRLLLVLYGSETWSLILREEHRLSVFENRMLRRIYGPKWEEVVESWRWLHNEELHKLYASPNTVRVINSGNMRWARHVACQGKMRNVTKLSVRKPEGTGPLRRQW